MGLKSTFRRLAERAAHPFHQLKASKTLEAQEPVELVEPTSKRESLRSLKASLKRRLHLSPSFSPQESAIHIETARELSIRPLRSESVLTILTTNLGRDTPTSDQHRIPRKPLRTPSPAPKIVLRPTSAFNIHPDTRLLEYANEVEYNFGLQLTKYELELVLLCLRWVKQQQRNEQPAYPLIISWPLGGAQIETPTLADCGTSSEVIVPLDSVDDDLQSMSKTVERISTPQKEVEENEVEVFGSPSTPSKDAHNSTDSSPISSPPSSICSPILSNQTTIKKMSFEDKNRIKQLRALAYMAVNGDTPAHAEIMELYEPLVRRRQIAPPPSNNCDEQSIDEDSLNSLDDDSEVEEYTAGSVSAPKKYSWSDSDRDEDDDDESFVFETGDEVGGEDAEVKYHKEWVIRKAGFVLELLTLADMGLLDRDVFATIKKHLYPKDAMEENEVEEKADELSELVCKKTVEGCFDEDQEQHLLVFAAWGPIDKPADWDGELEVDKPGLGEKSTPCGTRGPTEQEATDLPAAFNKFGRPIKPMRRRKA